MQRTLLITLFCLCYILSIAQPYDRSWIIGGANTRVKLTFNGNSFDTSSYFWGNSQVNDEGAMANISDTAGNILFFSNGVQVATSQTQVMENGDSLTDPLFYSAFVSGFSQPQTGLILPRSGNIFYLFYYSESDSLLNQGISLPDRFYYAIIDMGANGGAGKVISKKNIVYKGLFGDGRLTACRHANGRDWWMVHQGEANNQYFVYLVTPDSVYLQQVQQIGPSRFWDDDAGAESAFSPDGSKFITSTANSTTLIMDFDRCTGTFSNPDSFPVLNSPYSYNGQIEGQATGAASGCFSRSGRFAYITNTYAIWQYDTWAANLANSAVKVGQWDTSGPVGGFFAFNELALLPNGSIIIDNIQGGTGAFHLIDSPDVQGAGCHFIFNGLPTSVLNANTLPNMINYRLGALTGSGCDTITGIATIPDGGEEFSFMPIPATDDLTLRYQAIADFTVRIYTVTGQQMAALYMKANNNSQHIDTEILSTGVYEYEITRGAMVLQRGRLSVIK